jgi:hypothetical protein
MKLNPRDICMQTCRNAVVGSSAYFKIIHLPTGYSASCDRECKTHSDNKSVLDSARKKCATDKLTALMEGKDES